MKTTVCPKVRLSLSALLRMCTALQKSISFDTHRLLRTSLKIEREKKRPAASLGRLLLSEIFFTAQRAKLAIKINAECEHGHINFVHSE